MIRTKENRKYLKNFKGCYAYSYVDEYVKIPQDVVESVLTKG